MEGSDCFADSRFHLKCHCQKKVSKLLSENWVIIGEALLISPHGSRMKLPWNGIRELLCNGTISLLCWNLIHFCLCLTNDHWIADIGHKRTKNIHRFVRSSAQPNPGMWQHHQLQQTLVVSFSAKQIPRSSGKQKQDPIFQSSISEAAFTHHMLKSMTYWVPMLGDHFSVKHSKQNGCQF